jgi:hypothetical protein
MTFPDVTKKSFLKTLFRLATVSAALFLMATVFAFAAKADCGYTPAAKVSFSPQGATLIPAAFHPSSNRAGDQFGDRDHDNQGDPSIVGLWKFQFVVEENTVGFPNNTVFDFGYTTWHADSTEIMNSGTRTPNSSSFCMGVYKQTGRFAYHLNHFALSWNNTGTAFVGPANIVENVTLDARGDSYSGTFTVDQFDTNGNNIAHFQGKVTAQRVTAD